MMKYHQLTIMVLTISTLVFFATLQGANTGMAVMNAKDSCISEQEHPDAYLKGKVTSVKNKELKDYKDSCMNDATTVKFYCSNGEVKRQRIFCGFGEYCKEGICVKGRKEEPKKIYPSRDQFIQRYWTESPIKLRN